MPFSYATIQISGVKLLGIKKTRDQLALRHMTDCRSVNLGLLVSTVYAPMTADFGLVGAATTRLSILLA